MAKLSGKPSLALYLLLANGITWLGWIGAMIISRSQGLALPMMANLADLARDGFQDGTHLLISIMFHLAVYGPLVAALVTIGQAGGRAGLAELWHSMTRWRVDRRWYRNVCLLALVLAATPPILGALVGLTDAHSVVAMRALAWLPLILLFQLLTSGLGEEPGWRGLMLPLLQERHGRERAIWYGGLLWAVWHYPITIMTTIGQMGSDVPPAPMLITLVMALAGQTMTLIGMTYLYTWLMRHTRSVWMAMLFHALGNAMVYVFASDMTMAMNAAIAVMPWLVVLAMEKVLGKERFP